MGICRLPQQIVVPKMRPQLGDLEPGTLISLNGNGAAVPFYVAKHDYESGLNGTGRTLVVRKDCYDQRQWHTSDVNAYATSAIDTWLNGTYKGLLDADIQGVLGTTKFYYTPGNGNNTKTTLERAVFLLSGTELGQSHSYMVTEGTALDAAVINLLKIAKLNGSAVAQWTRSPRTNGTSSAWYLISSGDLDYNFCFNTYGARPAFTLPASMQAIIWKEV